VTLYFNIQYSSSLSVVVKSEVTVMAKRYGPRGRMSCTKLLSQDEYTKLNKKKKNSKTLERTSATDWASVSENALMDG